VFASTRSITRIVRASVVIIARAVCVDTANGRVTTFNSACVRIVTNNFRRYTIASNALFRGAVIVVVAHNRG
jgi:hypothetical protein